MYISIANSIGSSSNAGGGAGGGFDADYQAVLDYATTQEYTLPSASQQILQNQLVLDLKSGGIWSKLDSFAVFATDGDSDFALIDWIRLTDMTAVNSPTFTTDSGFNGDGASSYIDTNFTISTDATNYTQNNASTFAYIDIDFSDTDNGIYGTRVEDTTENRNQLRIRDVDYRPAINDVRPIISADYRSNNWHHQKRTSSTDFTTYLDSTSFTNNISSVDPSFFTIPMFLLAINYIKTGPQILYYSSSTIKIFGLGEALDNTDLQSAVNTYITSI